MGVCVCDQMSAGEIVFIDTVFKDESNENVVKFTMDFTVGGDCAHKHSIYGGPGLHWCGQSRLLLN